MHTVQVIGMHFKSTSQPCFTNKVINGNNADGWHIQNSIIRDISITMKWMKFYFGKHLVLTESSLVQSQFGYNYYYFFKLHNKAHQWHIQRCLLSIPCIPPAPIPVGPWPSPSPWQYVIPDPISISSTWETTSSLQRRGPREREASVAEGADRSGWHAAAW